MALPGFDTDLLLPLGTALGVGLLIGVVRERRLPEVAVVAGLRTHALAALAGVVAHHLGPAVFIAVLLLLGVFAAMSYRQTRDTDPGLTGEVALVLTALLGGLALPLPGLAGALGVLVAVLLYAKHPLHRLTRDLVSEQEVRDGLLLLASALVVLPLLPDRTLGPYDVFNPATLWKLVVLVMAISALGHVALRASGNRWGLAVAGFFAGYVSSTAATAGFGQRVRDTPALLSSAVGAVLLTGGLLGLHRGEDGDVPAPTAQSRMFRFRHALAFAAIITAVLFASAALNAWLGPRGAITAAVLAALAELHAAVATVGNLYTGGVIDTDDARWTLLGLLAAAWIAKTLVAWTTGGARYGLRVSLGLGASVAAVLAVLLLT